MKRPSSLILLILLSIVSFAQSRPKVAVVLSGGGAKGVAHVRALKVIEEAGIPIDMVVGTSMGSLVGGLYASGYTTQQLDSILSNMNWKDLLMDRVDRSKRSLALKQKTENYIIHADFEKSPFEVLEGGLLKGNSVSYLLSELTADHLSPMDYKDLPIPFACVATDIASNKEVVMHSGILAESMRSSMAIPGVFPPVKLDSMVLVDGGLKNNFPVDVARQMGADYVIGVSVTSEGLEYDELNSTVDVMLQVLDLVCTNKVEDNIKHSDVYMHVDVKGYSSASFTTEAVDTLLARGEQTARGKWEGLTDLRRKLEAYGPLPRQDRQPKLVTINHETFTPPSTIYNGRNKASFIGIGARFDNEERASLLVGGEHELNHRKHFHVGVNARLGRRIDLNAYTGFTPFRNWVIDLRYRYSHYETKLRNDQNEVAHLDYVKHRALLEFIRSWNQLRITFGSQYAHVRYSSISTKADAWHTIYEYPTSEKSLQYFLALQFDNQDSHLLPTRGMKWHVKYNYVTDNGYGFNGGSGVNVVEGYWHMAWPISRNTILSPSVEGRFIQDNNTYLSHCNFIGGINTYGHYITQQMAFAGINHYMITPNQILVGGLNFRQHLTTNNYLFTQTNYAIGSHDITSLFSGKNIFGAALGYGYKSPIGPVEFNLNWSNVTKKVGYFFNIGYMF